MAHYVSSVTPAGEGGISIIHLIGEKAPQIILKSFRTRRPRTILKPHRIYLGNFYNQNKIIDEVIVHFIPSKESISGINTVEINSHGGVFLARKIVETLVKQGARYITPSELLRLAVKNKRLDRVRKEALESLLKAPTALVARVLLDQYNGALSRVMKELPKKKHRAEKLIASARLGLALNYPKRIIIAGRPNTGKSTLFNTLVGKERVIVHPDPGTTRDTIEEMISIDDIPFILVDTAGWRVGASDVVERLGIRKTQKAIKTADIIIGVIDGSEPLAELDRKIFRMVRPKAVIWVVNKTDLGLQLSDKSLPAPAIRISALRHQGIARLKRQIIRTSNIPITKYASPQAVIFTPHLLSAVKNLS